MKKLLIASMAALVLSPLSAMAYEAGDMIVRVGATQVKPQDDYEPYKTTLYWGLTEVKASSNIQLGLNFVYMATDNIGVELLAASPFKHDISVMGVTVGDTKELPPTLSVQYYMNNSSIVTPYVGIGINYTTFFDENLKHADRLIPGASRKNIELKDSVGLAYQIGLDIALGKGWGLNVDLRKIDIDTEVDSSNLIDGYKVNIDPTVYSITALYKF